MQTYINYKRDVFLWSTWAIVLPHLAPSTKTALNCSLTVSCGTLGDRAKRVYNSIEEHCTFAGASVHGVALWDVAATEPLRLQALP